MKTHKLLLGLVTVVLLTVGQEAMAQSTLFNIPSTDAVSPGKVYAEFDFFAQMPVADGTSRLYVYAPRGVVGIGGGFEAGANMAFFHTSGATQSYFQPNVKWRIGNDEKGLAAAGGTILYVPTNNRSTVDTFGLVYGNFSKKIKTGNYGPRFSVGPYAVYDADGWSGTVAGIIAGYEQPIHSKVTVLADWFSGKNFFGYFTPGVSFTLPHSSLLNVGYSIGNDSYDGNNNRLLFVYYGITF